MITRQSAEALFGERSEIGVLEPGRRADLVVLRLARAGSDPWERLFDPRTEVVATLTGGTMVRRRSGHRTAPNVTSVSPRQRYRRERRMRIPVFL